MKAPRRSSSCGLFPAMNAAGKQSFSSSKTKLAPLEISGGRCKKKKSHPAKPPLRRLSLLLHIHDAQADQQTTISAQQNTIKQAAREQSQPQRSRRQKRFDASDLANSCVSLYAEHPQGCNKWQRRASFLLNQSVCFLFVFFQTSSSPAAHSDDDLSAPRPHQDGSLAAARGGRCPR